MERCPICGLGYVPGYLPDAARHRREHDEFVHGVSAKPLRDECIIFQDSTLRITVVSPFSSLIQRRRVERIARRANRETQYDFGLYGATEAGNRELDTHALVGHRNDRAIALLFIQRGTRVWVAKWASNGDFDEPTWIESDGPRWTIGFVWVLGRYRRQGLAQQMITEAAKFARLPVNALGWYTPFTDAGKALARLSHF
jgi:GNAT superfamily N-acetyltransferase